MTTSNMVDVGLSGSTGTGTFVGSTSPTLVTPTIGAASATTIKFATGPAIIDSNSNNVLEVNGAASAVNYIVVSNNATGLPPYFQAQGSDTNVRLLLEGKGNLGASIQGTAAADNANAGYVGEFVTSNIAFASAISYSNNSPKDLTSISLTAGDWDVWGNLLFNPSGNVITQAIIWTSTTSATIPDASLCTRTGYGSGVAIQGFNAPIIRINITSTTTVYLSGQASFASGTVTGCGTLSARRVR